LESARGQLAALGGAVQVAPGDQSDEDVLRRACKLHEHAYGDLTAIILAAGVGTFGRLASYSMRRFDKQLAVNLRAPFLLLQLALPMLRAGVIRLPIEGGRIVALSSLEGLHPEVGLSAYSASKAALNSLIRSVNAEEGSAGIRATAISPGYVNTDMGAAATDKISADMMIKVQDVVKVVDLVLSVSPNAVLPQIVINRSGGGPYQA